MIIYLLMSIIILLALSLMYSSFSICVVGILGIIIVLVSTKKCEKWIYNHLFIIFVILVTFMLVLFYGYQSKYGVPYYGGGSDDLYYEINSRYIISRGYLMPEQLITDSKLQYHNSKGFLWILSWIIRLSDIVGGYHTLTFRILNIFFLMTLSILTYRYFVENYNFSRKQNLIVLYALALFPNCQYISLHVFRDTLNILLLFSIFFIWNSNSLKTNKKVVPIKLILTVMITYLAYWIRAQNIIFIGAIILISLFLKNKNLSIKNFGVFLTLAIVAIVIANQFKVMEEIINFNDRYTNYRLSVNDGLSNRVFSMNLFPFGIFARLVYGLISPFPVSIIDFLNMFSDIDIFSNVIIAFGVIVQILMLPYLFKNIRYVDKVMMIFTILLLGIVITTFTFRHFIIIYPFLIILIVRRFLETRRNEKIFNFFFMSFLLVISASVYLLIK